MTWDTLHVLGIDIGSSRREILSFSMDKNMVPCLYSMHASHIQDDFISIAKLSNTKLWHSRLGHMSQKGMNTLEHFGYFPMLCFFNFPICEHCIYGKQNRLTSPSLDRKRLQALEFVHSDVSGPMPTKSLGGASYFVTFIDDSTRKVWVYTL